MGLDVEVVRQLVGQWSSVLVGPHIYLDLVNLDLESWIVLDNQAGI